MLALLFSLVFARDLTLLATNSKDVPEIATWEEWKQMFGRTYDMQGTEHDDRMKIFQENIEYIKAENAKTNGYTLGVNQFCDLSSDEFMGQQLLFAYNRSREMAVEHLKNDPPQAVDWRTKNAVTPVKNQGQCGSCWAFSTTGSVEGAVAIKTGKLPNLSEQQLVDCGSKTGNHGCNGGLMDYGFKYIEEAGGVDSESDYPYTAHTDSCDSAKEKRHVATVSGYKDVTPSNAQQMMAAVALGPVSIAIEADERAFQLYKSGVFTATCGNKLDHGVLVVGYDASASEPYWIVKNSWGATWGESGYIRFGMNSGGAAGQCGMLMQPSYPIAGEAPPSPSPGPGPTPGPKGDHYADPYITSCTGGDQNMTIQGVAGAVCVPECTSTCPDAPSGFVANPQCALSSPTGSKYCALLCTPGSTGACDPSAKATCKPIQGVGVCTYDESGPGPAPPADDHYEDPKNGCSSDETATRIQGLDGSFCAPKCTGVFKNKCPNAPSDDEGAHAMCALQDTSGNKYCALECDPSDSSACNPSAGLTCKSIQGIGLCTWNDSKFQTLDFVKTMRL